MLAVYSDGTYLEVATGKEATDHARTQGIVLDSLRPSDATVHVPLALITKFDREKGPGTSHAQRNATVDDLLTYAHGRS